MPSRGQAERKGKGSQPWGPRSCVIWATLDYCRQHVLHTDAQQAWTRAAWHLRSRYGMLSSCTSRCLSTCSTRFHRLLEVRNGCEKLHSAPRCCRCASACERWRTVTYDTCPSASMCNHLLGCLLKLFIGSSAVRLDLFVKPLLPTSCALLTTRGVGLSLSIALPFDMKGAITARVLYPREAAACNGAH